MLRCTASFVIAAYDKYASFLRICTPCLRTFYEVVPKSTFYEGIKIDGFVKSPDAALRGILRCCSVPKSTLHSSGFARLACELFTKPSPKANSDTTKIHGSD